MPPTYRIHPGIGIARLGNSPDAFCISPETPAALPLECTPQGDPLVSADGTTEQRIRTFKDAQGRVKRQAARFQVYVFDEEHPEGRPLRLGDAIAGGGNDGVLVDIQWRAHLANKKAAWYEFRQLEGEHGYAASHPLRNAGITAPEARQRLIIDPGPRTVDCTSNRNASFDRDAEGLYATTFPPPLQPSSIDTLGAMLTDSSGRLLVLGGHGNSGTYRYGEFGQPRIDEYANNDGWFDDTSDGPVMARLVMYSKEVEQVRFIDVEYPAWVVVGYPAYVPEILDMVTIDDVVEDLAIREFATRTDLYGTAGTFRDPQCIDHNDREALMLWRAGRLEWNPQYRPWFYRDIWPILYRPDQFTYTSSALGQSNYPHNQSARGNFDPTRLGVPPTVDADKLRACERRCIRDHHSGELFIDALGPAFALLEKQAQARIGRIAGGVDDDVADDMRGVLTSEMAAALKAALATFARTVRPGDVGREYAAYLRDWRAAPDAVPGYGAARDALERAVQDVMAQLPRQAVARGDTHAGETAARAESDDAPLQPAAPGRSAVQRAFDDMGTRVRVVVLEQLGRYYSGRFLEDCRRKCVAASTSDTNRAYREFLYALLRRPGEENQFGVNGKVSSRTHNLPLMPLLAGDNPISNTLPSKFLRLTEYQFYLLRQWSLGLFVNEELEGWAKPDPWQPYAAWVNRTARDLDRGVLSNLLGGAFCPGGELAWVIRNPAIFVEPWRVRADPAFYMFRQTGATANAWRGALPEKDYAAYTADDLSQGSNFDVGLQPGDLTKYGACPWQADFNECTTQDINVTYDDWNVIYPASDNDSLMRREERVWETLWWPGHRPLQTWEVTGMKDGKPVVVWLDWSRGVPQTNAGDLKMVTEWWRLPFVMQNPWLPKDVPPSELPPDQKYVSVERTGTSQEDT